MYFFKSGTFWTSLRVIRFIHFEDSGVCVCVSVDQWATSRDLRTKKRGLEPVIPAGVPCNPRRNAFLQDSLKGAEGSDTPH